MNLIYKRIRTDKISSSTVISDIVKIVEYVDIM
jgi:hypothetical protein